MEFNLEVSKFITVYCNRIAPTPSLGLTSALKFNFDPWMLPPGG